MSTSLPCLIPFDLNFAYCFLFIVVVILTEILFFIKNIYSVY